MYKYTLSNLNISKTYSISKYELHDFNKLINLNIARTNFISIVRVINDKFEIVYDDKMCKDSILIHAYEHGHENVLKWFKKSNIKLSYNNLILCVYQTIKKTISFLKFLKKNYEIKYNKIDAHNIFNLEILVLLSLNNNSIVILNFLKFIRYNNTKNILGNCYVQDYLKIFHFKVKNKYFKGYNKN